MVNYANDPKILKEATDKVIPAYNSCTRNRLPKERDWDRFIKIWSMQRHDMQKYSGRADMRHPEPRRACETVARKLGTLVYPARDYLSVLPNANDAGTTFHNAEAVECVLKHYADNATKVRMNSISVLRQYVALGTTIVKTGWKEVKKSRRTKGGKWEEYTFASCPTWNFVDLFRFYVFPWNIHSLDEAIIIYQNFTQTKDWVEMMVREGHYVKEPQPFKQYKNPDVRLQNLFFQDPNITSDHGNDRYNLVECWTDLWINGLLVPCRIHFQSDGDILMIEENPFDHGLPPYDAAQYVRHLAPLFYGQGIYDVIESQAAELNDITNQIMDNKNIVLNPPVIVDPSRVRVHQSIKWGVGAKWLADPDGIKPLLIPDMTNTGHVMRSEVKAEILDASDATPNMPAQMRGASRTATRDMAMNVEMNSELSEFITQLCGMNVSSFKKMHSNIIQNMSPKDKIKILRKNSGGFSVKTVTPAELDGSFDFSWIAANEVSLNRVQSQQLISAVSLFSRAGIQIDYGSVAKRVLKYGFGIDDLGEVMPDARTAMPQEEENDLLLMGKYVPIHPTDNDDDHLSKLNELYGVSTGESKEAFEDHIRRHTDAKEVKRQAVQQALQQQMMAGKATVGKTGQEQTPMPVGAGDEMKG